MDTQKVTAEYRLSQWAQVIQARLDSGKSIKDFCLTAGISRNAYFYWQKRLRDATCAELAKSEEPRNLVPNGWVQLAPSQPQQMKATLDIEISGCRVTADVDTKYDTVTKVIKNSGFDANTNPNDPYKTAEKYLKNRDGSNAKLEKLINIVLDVYNGKSEDNTNGAVL